MWNKHSKFLKNVLFISNLRTHLTKQNVIKAWFSPRSKLDDLWILASHLLNICTSTRRVDSKYYHVLNKWNNIIGMSTSLPSVTSILCDRDTSQGQTGHTLCRMLFPLLQQLDPQCGHHQVILSQLIHGKPVCQSKYS